MIAKILYPFTKYKAQDNQVSVELNLFLVILFINIKYANRKSN